MWFWQRKSMRKRFLFWTQLGSISTGFHLLFLFALFSWYRDPFCILSFTMRPDHNNRATRFSINIEEPPAPEAAEKIEEKPLVQEIPKPIDQPKKLPEKQLEQKKAESIPARIDDLYKEISQKWSPPPGVPQETACQLLLHIDSQGAIVDVAVAKSSGVLLFDLAAQAAIDELNCPKWAWGKSIALTFSMEIP